MKSNNDTVKILFCVAKCKERVGRGLVTEILQGSHSVRVFNRRLNQNSAFGSMKGRSTEDVEALISQAIEAGLAEETTDEFPRLCLTDQGKAMLREYEEEAGAEEESEAEE